MATVIVALSMSLDGFVGDPADQAGPLFDWYQNGEVEVPTANPQLTFRTSQTSARYLREAIDRDTSFVLVSRALLGNIQHYRERMGWTTPWFSSAGSDFNVDLGLTSDAGETFGLSVFLRDGEDVFRAYFTNRRGTEALGSTWTFLDPTPLGRQALWEDSPQGYPQTPPDVWWRRHDEYDDATTAAER